MVTVRLEDERLHLMGLHIVIVEKMQEAETGKHAVSGQKTTKYSQTAEKKT